MVVSFSAELERYGPEATAVEPVSLAEAEAYCRKLAKTHYENFPVVSWLLPGKLHQHFYNVYAYCRWADDLGDEVEGSARSLELLGWWREQLDRCYAGLKNPPLIPPLLRGGDTEIGSPLVRGGDNEKGERGPSGPRLEPADSGLPSSEETPAGLRLPLAGASKSQEYLHPVFVALQNTIAECRIPKQPFEDLISAFEQDQRVLEYDTFEQLLDYCRRSADPVGRLVLYVCGQFNERNAKWSDSVCTGLQLANFWQDVARDFDIGRVYLPAEDRRRFGYSRDDLNSRVTNEALLQLMQFEVGRAREFLEGGLPLVEEMPGRLQIDIELFIRGGLRILERIEGIGYRVWEKRPVVTAGDAAGLFFRCLCRCLARQLRFHRKTPAGQEVTVEESQAAK